MTLRWRKDKPETGLRAVGAGPRGHRLFLDDNEDELAIVSPDGGGWLRPLSGWYWYAMNLPDNKLYNSYAQGEIFETEKEAKAAALAYVKKALGRK